MTQTRVARGSGPHAIHPNTKPAKPQHKDGNFLVTEVKDDEGSYSVIEDLEGDICTRRTRPIPIVDLVAMADLSAWSDKP